MGILQCFGLFMIMGTMLHAGSVRLINNSAYDLRAVIRGSDGSYLGEVVVSAQNSIGWQDSYGSVGQSRGPNAQMESGYRSKTPIRCCGTAWMARITRCATPYRQGQ